MSTIVNAWRSSKTTRIALIVLSILTFTCCGGLLLSGGGNETEPEPTATLTQIVATATAEPTNTPYATGAPQETNTPAPSPTPTARPTPYRIAAHVVEVVDGDTIKVVIDGEIYTVRYIGIDTPETVHPSKPVEWMGVEASVANRRLVDGETVYLEKDVSETDRYGRLLRYVFLADGTFVNAELVRMGYARVSTYPPDVRYQDLFLTMEREARQARRGLWGPTPTPNLQPTATSKPRPTATPKPRPTATPVPSQPTAAPPAAPVCQCTGNIYNCSDFSSHAAAQACYQYCISIGKGDIHRLDADHDGIACESLP